MNVAATMDESEMLRVELDVLRREHRELDAQILGLEAATRPDVLTVRRLKKHKLSLKDRIARIEDRLLPDIIA